MTKEERSRRLRKARMAEQRTALVQAWRDIEEALFDFEPGLAMYDHETGFHGTLGGEPLSKKKIAKRFKRIAKIASKASVLAEEYAKREHR